MHASFALDRFVDDVRLLTPDPSVFSTIEHVPDGRTTLGLRVFEDSADLTVIGPRTRALRKTVKGVARAFLVQFKPGWSTPLLGAPATAFADTHVSLEDVWGTAGRELRDELVAADGISELLACVSRAIGRRTRESFEPASSLLSRRAIRLIEDGESRIETVAARLNVSARHLRRAFTESVGIGPKEYARTVRLQRAVRLSATTDDWVQIASDAGYYDQAHLIGDFRALMGVTPGAYARRRAGGIAPVRSVAAFR